MKRLVIAGTVLGILSFFSAAAEAKQKLRDFFWQDVPDAPWGRYGTVQPATENTPARLVIANPRQQAVTIPLLTISHPGIRQPRWALHGRIRCQDVGGRGYLEMWSHFPDGSRCYSRTLSVIGPMQWLTGSSDWRPVAVVFYSAVGRPAPVKLTLRLHLPQEGTVELEPLALWEYGPDEDPQTSPAAWWSDAAGGWIGGVGGATVGILGGILATLTVRQKARKFVLACHIGLLVAGGILLLAALTALLRSQPFGVSFPLLLLGGLSVLIFPTRFLAARRMFLQKELRQMQAMDMNSKTAPEE